MALHALFLTAGFRHGAGLLACALALAGCGGGSSEGAPVPGSPAAPPVIATQPAAQAVVQGQAARFSVAASGAGLTYQWLRNGVAIAGAQASSYTTPLLQTTDNASQYSVRVANTGGSATAIPVAVRVFADTELPAPQTANLSPSATGSGIVNSFGEHTTAINPAVSSNGRLFVFFAGTDAVPNDYRLIVQAAANNGYAAIGLAYPNDVGVTLACNNADSDCTRQIREEAWSGSNVSSRVAVNPANAVQNRLSAALRLLAQQQPQNGWGRFLDAAGNVQWALVRVGGHSQGGGTAVYASKQVALERACFFASPADSMNGQQQAAPWLAVAGATSNQRLYGLSHLQDGIVPFPLVQQTWGALQLGGIASADGAVPPFGNSRALSTNVPRGNLLVAAGLAFHNLPVVDFFTPMEGTLPTFRRVWQHLCFAP